MARVRRVSNVLGHRFLFLQMKLYLNASMSIPKFPCMMTVVGPKSELNSCNRSYMPSKAFIALNRSLLAPTPNTCFTELLDVDSGCSGLSLLTYRLTSPAWHLNAIRCSMMPRTTGAQRTPTALLHNQVTF